MTTDDVLASLNDIGCETVLHPVLEEEIFIDFEVILCLQVQELTDLKEEGLMWIDEVLGIVQIWIFSDDLELFRWLVMEQDLILVWQDRWEA